MVSAFFTALAGGLYALWFGYLDPIFQFSILIGSYMVLMALLGGVRSLFGPLLGAVIVGYALEYFKIEYGDTQFHLVATRAAARRGRAVHARRRLPGDRHRWSTGSGRQAASIREVSAAELLERDASRAADAAPDGGRPMNDRCVRSRPTG